MKLMPWSLRNAATLVAVTSAFEFGIQRVLWSSLKSGPGTSGEMGVPVMLPVTSAWKHIGTTRRPVCASRPMSLASQKATSSEGKHA